MSSPVLLNQIKAKAYERAKLEKKTHNFALALPEDLAEQADEMLKRSYSLEFLGIGRLAKERGLEDRLVEQLRDFILELGYGFCFVGRQHRLELGKKEFFVDLLPKEFKGKQSLWQLPQFKFSDTHEFQVFVLVPIQLAWREP